MDRLRRFLFGRPDPMVVLAGVLLGAAIIFVVLSLNN